MVLLSYYSWEGGGNVANGTQVSLHLKHSSVDLPTMRMTFGVTGRCSTLQCFRGRQMASVTRVLFYLF